MNVLKLACVLSLGLTACGAPDLDEDGFDEVEDCNDNDAAIHPDATEVLGNEVDEDCDGEAQPFPDADADGYDAGVDCDDDNPDANPGATEVLGNDVDEDCDGVAQPYAFVGAWSVDSAQLFSQGNPIKIGAASGTLDIDDVLDADLVLMFQGPSVVTLALAGPASAGADDEAFSLALDGDLSSDDDDERIALESTWECTISGTTADCAGEFVVLTGEENPGLTAVLSLSQQ